MTELAVVCKGTLHDILQKDEANNNLPMPSSKLN